MCLVSLLLAVGVMGLAVSGSYGFDICTERMGTWDCEVK